MQSGVVADNGKLSVKLYNEVSGQPPVMQQGRYTPVSPGNANQ